MSHIRQGLTEAARTHLVLLRTDANHIERYVQLAHEYGVSNHEIAEIAWLSTEFVADILRGEHGEG